MIAEAEHLEAFRFDHGRATRIRMLAFIGEMLAAIELDDELCLMADEIGDIAFDRYLPA
jgi:hypothetical protein